MAAAVTPLCTHAPDLLLGVSCDRNNVTVSVQGDGFVAYSPDTERKIASYVLGRAQSAFAAPVQTCGGSYVAAVQAGHNSPHTLVRIDGSASGHTTIMDAQPRLALTAAVHSLHGLRSGSKGPAEVAVVLADGTTATVDWEAVAIRPASRTSDAASTAPPSASASCGSSLVVASQVEPGSPVRLAFYAHTPAAGAGAGSLQLVCTCESPPPHAAARLLRMSLAPAAAVLLWSHGWVSVQHVDYLRGGRGARRCVSAQLGEHLVPSGLAHSQPAAVPAPATTPSSSRKRKERQPQAATVGAGADSNVLCLSLGEQHVLLAAVHAEGGGAVVRHAVLDAHYACVLAAGCTPLPRLAPAALAAAAAAPQLLWLPPSEGGAVLVAGGAVFELHLQLPRADLAGLVGRLAVSAATAAASAAAVDGGVSASATTSVLRTGPHLLPPAVAAEQQLGPAQLLQAVAAGEAAGQLQQAQQQQHHQQQQQAGSLCVLHAAPELSVGVGEAGSDVLESAAQHVQALLAAQQPTSRQALQQASAKLVHVLQQQQQHALRAGSARLSQPLVGGLAAALAAAGLWTELGGLLVNEPLVSFVHCPDLLPALVGGGQFEMLAWVVKGCDDVPAAPLVAALQLLLDDGWGGGRGAADAHRQGLRRQAEQVVATAEAAAAAPEASPEQRAGALAAAKRAALVVDGFSAREVCLHALLAADADMVEVQGCLRALPAQQVLALLRYLAKWVDKQGCGAAPSPEAREWACAPPLPSALALAPGWPQVLAWLAAVLDAHLAKLALLPAAEALLAQLAGAVRSHASSTSVLLPLKGVAEHMAVHAPLPKATVAAMSNYTVEVLDLRVFPHQQQQQQQHHHHHHHQRRQHAAA